LRTTTKETWITILLSRVGHLRRLLARVALLALLTVKAVDAPHQLLVVGDKPGTGTGPRRRPGISRRTSDTKKLTYPACPSLPPRSEQ
jgi:hypothetical protein